jgi:hypothetical protein
LGGRGVVVGGASRRIGSIGRCGCGGRCVGAVWGVGGMGRGGGGEGGGQERSIACF